MADKQVNAATSGSDPYRRSASFWERKSMEILAKLISPRTTPPSSPGPSYTSSATGDHSSPKTVRRKSSGRTEKTTEISAKQADKVSSSPSKNSAAAAIPSPRTGRREEDSVRTPKSRRNSDAKPSQAVVFSPSATNGPSSPSTSHSKSRSSDANTKDQPAEGYRSDTPTKSRPSSPALQRHTEGYKSDGTSKKERRKSQTLVSNGIVNALSDKPVDVVPLDSPKSSSRSDLRRSRDNIKHHGEIDRRSSEKLWDNAISSPNVNDDVRRSSSSHHRNHSDRKSSSRHHSAEGSSTPVESPRVTHLEDLIKTLTSRVDALQTDLDKEKSEKEMLNRRLELAETALVSLVEDFRTQSALIGTLRADFEIMKMEHSSSQGHITQRSLEQSVNAHATSMDESDGLDLLPAPNYPVSPQEAKSTPAMLNDKRKAKSTKEFAAEIVGAAVGGGSANSTPTITRRLEHKKTSSKSSLPSSAIQKARSKGSVHDEEGEDSSNDSGRRRSSKRRSKKNKSVRSTSVRSLASADVSDDSKQSDRPASEAGDLGTKKSSRIKELPKIDLVPLQLGNSGVASDAQIAGVPGSSSAPELHSTEEDVDDAKGVMSPLASVATPGSAFERRSSKTNNLLHSWLSPLADDEKGSARGRGRGTHGRRGSEGELQAVKPEPVRGRSGTAPNIFDSSHAAPPATPRVKSSSDDESEMSPKVKRDSAVRRVASGSRSKVGMSKEAPDSSSPLSTRRRGTKKGFGSLGGTSGSSSKRKVVTSPKHGSEDGDDVGSNGGSLSPKSAPGGEMADESNKAAAGISSPFLLKLKGASRSSFGTSLTQIPIDEARGVPTILAALVNGLKQETFYPHDLFERKMDSSKIESLKKRLDAGAPIVKDSDSYVVAAALKRFFIELPDCLLGASKRKYWAEVAAIDDDTLAVSTVRSLFHALDRVTRRTLEYVCDLFTRIVNTSKKLISTEKIGSVFGPIFLRAKKSKGGDDDPEVSDENLLPDRSAGLVELFMSHYVEIFAFESTGVQFHSTTFYVKAATVDNFVLLLLDSNYLEKEFPAIFFTTCTYFIDNVDLLQRLIDHYREWASDDKWQARIRMRILMTLKTWIKQYGWSLHRDDEFKSLLQDFVESVLEDTDSNKDLEIGILYSLTAPTHARKEEDVILAQRLLMHAALSPREISLDLSKCDSKVVANQISLMDSRLVALIEPSEFVNGASLNPATSPHYTAMVNYINRITHWVAWDIVSKSTITDRVRVLGFWIDVAKYCKSNGDFNGSWAVFGAFGLHPVARLSQTWEKLSRSEQSRLKRLTALFDPRLNFSEYRKQLDRAQQSGPTVPILAFLPKDIIRFETDPTFTEQRLVDFEKMRGIYSTLQGIAHCKNETLPFQRNEDIWECFLSLPQVPESRLEEYSYRAEPKANSSSMSPK